MKMDSDLEWYHILITLMLLALILLYELNSSFSFHAKFILYYCLLLLSSVIVIILSIPRGRDPYNSRWLSIGIPYSNMLLGISHEMRGMENLQKMKNKTCVVVINHQSSIDIMGLCGTDLYQQLHPMVVLVKKELLYLGPFGLAAAAIGAVFINRLQSEQAKITLNKVKERMHKENLKLLVFPEGTRNKEAGLLPFKKGAFHVAITAQVPVLPIVFSSYDDFYNKKEKKFTPGKVCITILPPISTEGKTLEDLTTLTESVRKQMLFTYNESSTPRHESNGL